MLIRLSFLLFIFFGFITIAFSQKTPESLYQEGKELLKRNPRKAFSVFENTLEVSRQNHKEELYLASLLELIQLAETNLPEKQKIVFSWSKKALLDLANLQTLPMAQLYYSTAQHYFNQATEIDSATLYFKKALNIRLALLDEDSELIATCYHSLGDIYKYVKYDYTEAEKCYEKSLRIREHISTTSRMTLASNYYNLATTNRSQRDFEKALAYGLSAIEIIKEIRDYTFLELGYTAVANIYRDMGQSEEARKFYQKAIKLNALYSKSASLLALNSIGLGETLKNDSAWEQAADNFKKALIVFKQLDDAGALKIDSKKLWLHCQFQLTETYLLQKQYAQAQKILALHFNTLKRMKMDEGRQLADSYNMLGNYFKSTKNYDSALYYYQKSITVAIPAFRPNNLIANPTEDEIQNANYIYLMLENKANIFHEKHRESGNLKDLRNAISCLRLSEKLLSLERNLLDAEESKWKFLDENYNVYEQLLNDLLLCQKSDHSDTLQALVFYYFERGKARSLNNALTQVELTSKINNEDTLLQRLNEFKRVEFKLEHQLSVEQQKKIPDSALVTKVRQQQIRLDRDIQKLKEQIEYRFPGYFRIKFKMEVTSLAEVKAFLKQQNRILLEYFYGNNSVYGIGITPEAVVFRRISSTDSLQFVLTNFLRHFSDEHSSIDQDVFANFTESAYTLNQYLLQPFHSIMSHSKVVQIVPDGLISLVPFELLIEDKPTHRWVNYKELKYAIRKYSFGYTYSSSILLTQEHARTKSPTLLAMGFTGKSTFRDKADELTEIEGAELELKALKNKFKDGTFMVGQQVTEANFKLLAPTFDIIHLAIHGHGNTDKLFSSTLFFQAAKDSVEDGRLHAYELYGLRFNAQLAVLTACESGIGKAYKGEGMMSIATAFTYAGCKNTLMSLWKVNDQASVGLMNHFYDYLLKGNTIDQALAGAKLEYLEQADELTADPKIWAPLVAYGDLSPVVSNNSSRVKWFTLTTVALILLLLFWQRRRIKPLLSFWRH